MDENDLKEHYRRDIQFHLRCAHESVVKLGGKLSVKNVDDVDEMQHLTSLSEILLLTME